jgi:hypothetical protein
MKIKEKIYLKKGKKKPNMSPPRSRYKISYPTIIPG